MIFSVGVKGINIYPVLYLLEVLQKLNDDYQWLIIIFLLNFSAIIIDHPTYSASRHHYDSNNPMFAGREKILNDGFFTNIDNSRAYIVSKMDLDEWEKTHGRIPNGALVILRTGWSQYFKQPDNFFGNFADNDEQVFPGNIILCIISSFNPVLYISGTKYHS